MIFVTVEKKQLTQTQEVSVESAVGGSHQGHQESSPAGSGGSTSIWATVQTKTRHSGEPDKDGRPKVRLVQVAALQFTV